MQTLLFDAQKVSSGDTLEGSRPAACPQLAQPGEITQPLCAPGAPTPKWGRGTVSAAGRSAAGKRRGCESRPARCRPTVSARLLLAVVTPGLGFLRRMERAGFAGWGRGEEVMEGGERGRGPWARPATLLVDEGAKGSPGRSEAAEWGRLH